MTQGVWVILTIMFLLIGIQSSEGFRENIVRGWLFDEGSGKTAKDASGNGNDGRIEGKAEWVEGVFGPALRFDGST